MCIRDSYDTGIGKEGYSIIGQGQIDRILSGKPEERRELFDCLLYTSDAADERSSGDLGGRRIIKKKTQDRESARRADDSLARQKQDNAQTRNTHMLGKAMSS